MHFTISKERLADLLYLTNTIVERRTTMPILANVRISADAGKVQISATDLDISLVGEADATVKTPGSITVGGRVFYEIARELPGDLVTIQLTKGQRVEIESGQARFKINGISADEFPSIIGTTLKKRVSVDAQKLYDMFEKTAFCVSADENRHNINGVYVEALATGPKNDKQLIRFVATDGHRLAMVDRPAEGLVLQEHVIIPRKGIQEIKKVLEKNSGAAAVDIQDGFFSVESNSVTIGVRLVDGQFPDYRQVIPVETKTTIEAGRNEILSAVRRVALVTTDKSKTVKFHLVNNNLVISSSSPEYGEATEAIDVKQTGEDITIGFSARYVLDLLGAMQSSETIIMKLSGELGPGVFSGNDDDFYNCIVMPMRFE